MTKGMPVRQRRVDNRLKSFSKYLDLSWSNIEVIPDEVFDAERAECLEELRLEGNRISELTSRIVKLKKLKHIDIRRNPIRKIHSVPGLVLDWSAYQENRETVKKEHVKGIRLGPYFKDAVHELGSFPRLEIVDFGQDESGIDFLPAEIDRALDVLLGDQPHIKNLSLFHVGLVQVPAAVSKFKSLERLDLIGNQINSLPSELAALENLRDLAVSDTGIGFIPDWVFDFSELETLGVGYNKIRNIPRAIGRLSNLRSFVVNDNFISDLPMAMAKNSNLKWVHLNNNLFKRMPAVLFELKQLQSLSIASSGEERSISWIYGHVPIVGAKRRRGRIREVGADILSLADLSELNVSGQPIQTPPEEVVAQGVGAIKNYWRQRAEVGTDYLCEAKLIIVGEPGAGKTSLANKILKPEYELRPEEKSTEGIDVLRWSFPASIRPRSGASPVPFVRDFHVNIWDFGGQEIYHSTHQFFLTRRSVYVLVSDSRKEDTDFYYWLSVVELLSEGSPIIVVMNEKQDRRRDMDEAGVRGRFPGLREVMAANLNGNRGLEDVVRTVRHHLEGLPHIGEALPTTWRRVREALERDTRNYISLDEYLRICEGHGFTRHEDKIQLGGYLHDLGICVHFQDDPVLKGIVILKPKWGTDAVYRVLDDSVVLSRKGRFSSGDLGRIWSEPEYAPVHHELLQLMMRFRLCYRLEGGGTYIAPQLLGSAAPSPESRPAGGVVVKYEYEFMPKGIVTRLIVGLHQLIADQSLVWRSGVVLERDGVRCEIVEEYARRQISVRVFGAYPRELMAIVDNEILRIHGGFRKLRCKTLVPCRCSICARSVSPEMYVFDVLRRFARDGRGIQCQLSYELVDARSLIEETLPGRQGGVEEIVERVSGAAMAPRVSSVGGVMSDVVLREVFVSYAWGGESEEVVDGLERAFLGKNIKLLRDKNEVGYRDSIREFMRRLGRGRYVVVVVGKKYLESPSCMFELTELASSEDFRGRIFPVLLPDAGVFSPVGVIDYVKYWEEKIRELDLKLKEVESTDLGWIQEEISFYRRVRVAMARIAGILRDMNARSVESHRSSSYREIVSAIETRSGGAD
ncbi:COR domain-containing protein [Corallococcus sp. CA053C]|uniref:COR domain-containing protein n=1 Tax=Corallococcus sp. CA053C TaxID=2316732 RepID=UPI001315A6E5|nr:COR domain-containing protein [Corallococcus sp. CA053C]